MAEMRGKKESGKINNKLGKVPSIWQIEEKDTEYIKSAYELIRDQHSNIKMCKEEVYKEQIELDDTGTINNSAVAGSYR